MMLADLGQAEAVDCVLPDPVGSIGAESNALPPLVHLAGKP